MISSNYESIKHTTQPEISAGINFGGLAQGEAEMILAVSNLVVERLKLLTVCQISNSTHQWRPQSRWNSSLSKIAMEQFTVKSYIRGHHMSKLFWTPAIGEILSCKQEPKTTAHPSDSFTVVGHVAWRVSSFQVAEHGHLTDHTNGMTKLTTSIVHIGGF